MAGRCALGSSWREVGAALQAGRTGVRVLPELGEILGLRTRLGAPVEGEPALSHHPRKKLRSLGRVSRLAAAAAEDALTGAKLLGTEAVSDGRLGLAFGSTHGSTPAAARFTHAFVVSQSTRGASPVDYLQMMSHTCAANLAQLFEVRGMVMPTVSACASGSHAIGAAFDAIRAGRQPLMLAGGAEELHPIVVAVFDMLLATSCRNEAPDGAPAPFDAHRDGLVVGEGAGALLLEEMEHARARGAPALAEVVGFGMCCDGGHLTQPDAAGMERAMALALADAGVDAAEIGYVNAHATATVLGDVAESQAIHALFGEDVPVSSLKGHLGHTLGACGALETWIALAALRDGWLPPTRNLVTPDPQCAPLDHVLGAPRRADVRLFLKNSFAFGGINTSLVLRLLS